eukprot:Hpha_TRINITY_DN14925_c0_g3::TRINITY_DN14925_c0_g3_i1::g.144948::m.144948/K06276/PDPK1; 3-phosphoinositide dependent protein kinase-1
MERYDSGSGSYASDDELDSPTSHRLCTDDLTLGKQLGAGSFARVHLATCRQQPRLVAVKIMNGPSSPGRAARRGSPDPEKEANMLRVGAHPTVTRLFAFLQHDGGEWWLVMEPCTRGSLVSFVRSQPPEGAVWKAVPRFVGELVLGLEHLQQVGVVHRDMKSENVLMTKAFSVKIADFGSAVAADECGAAIFGGTVEYMSPELLRDGHCHPAASDLWGLGCIVYEMYCGRTPFADPGEGGDAASEAELFERIRQGRFEVPAAVPGASASLIRGLLTPEVTERLGAREGDERGMQELKGAEFFSGLEWEELLTTAADVVLPDEEDPADWQAFLLEKEEIVRIGLVTKHRFLSSKRRVLILTSFPRLFYCDPVTRDVKGQVPVSGEVGCMVGPAPDRFKVRTPRRTYNLQAPSASEWVAAIEGVFGSRSLGTP